MSSSLMNSLTKKRQYIALFGTIFIAMLVLLTSFFFVMDGTKEKHKEKKNIMSGVVDESFTDANATSALDIQQEELKILKKEIRDLKEELNAEKHNDEIKSNNLNNEIKSELEKLKSQYVEKKKNIYQTPFPVEKVEERPVHIKFTQFQYGGPSKGSYFSKNSRTYVPTGTFVKAIILGGTDADASVNGQSNSSVMLFKLVDRGTLPNGGRSDLLGCFVTASAYGDISSERAYAKLDRLSCAKPGRPILDISVSGWVFFGGKVGIKGKPMMRDGKILKWAGISGALSGFASAAETAQMNQSVSPLGVINAVEPQKVFVAGAAGGASKSMDTLANYYIKRADQYHPVIQVGSGNLVTIVFKDGFSLIEKVTKEALKKHNDDYVSPTSISNNTHVPKELLQRLDNVNLGQTIGDK